MPATLTLRTNPVAETWDEVAVLKTPLDFVTVYRYRNTGNYRASGTATANRLMAGNNDPFQYGIPLTFTADSPEHAGRLVAERLRDGLISAVRDLDDLVVSLGGESQVHEPAGGEVELGGQDEAS